MNAGPVQDGSRTVALPALPPLAAGLQLEVARHLRGLRVRGREARRHVLPHTLALQLEPAHQLGVVVVHCKGGKYELHVCRLCRIQM